MNNDEVAASDAVVNSMREYAEHTIASKFPSPIDGLMRIHRRALWMSRDIDKNTKMKMLVARTMEIHPYGDSSIESTIVRLSQPFSNTYPLVLVDGNFGSYAGKPPADGRYLDARRSEFTYDVFFSGVNVNTFDYIPNELGTGYEPLFLIPKIPTALITASFGLAVGFRSAILPLNFNNVCDMAIAYIEAKRSMNDVTKELQKHPHWFVPDSMTEALLRNGEQLEHLVGQGTFDAATIYDGVLQVTPTSIIIKTLPFGLSTTDLAKSISEACSDKNHVFSELLQEVRDLSTGHMTMKVILSLRRGVDVFAALPVVKQFIRFTNRVTPSMQWVSTRNKRLELNALGVLDAWYTARHRSVMSDYKHQQKRLVDQYLQSEARMIVVDNADKVIHIVRHSADNDVAIATLVKEFSPNLTLMQAKYLTTLRLQQLTAKGRVELVEEMKRIKEELGKLKDKFANIDTAIISAIKELKSKYQLKRKALYPNFKGYAQLPTGVIQYWTEGECHELLEIFKPEDLTMHTYPSGSIYKYSLHDEEVTTEDEMCLAKEFKTDRLVISKRKLHTTLCLRDGYIYRLQGLRYRKSDEITFYYAGDQFTSISKTGLVDRQLTTSVMLRKQLEATGTQSDVCYISHHVDDELIVVHGNKGEPNMIRIDRVVPGQKLVKSPLGELIILGVYRPQDSFIINVPECILNRVKILHIAVEDVNKLLGDKKNIRVYLNRKVTDNDKPIGKNKHGMNCL